MLDVISSFIDGRRNPGVASAAECMFEWQSPLPDGAALLIVDSPLEVVGQAVASAQLAFRAHAHAPTIDRIGWLNAAARLLEQRADSLVRLLVEDVGKPVRSAKVEVTRGVQFLLATAGQLAAMGGELLPLDSVQAGVGHFGMTRRMPYGVVAAITPFNAPVNLLVQKVAPALAAGNAVVVKPHPAGTRAAIAVAELFVEAGLPPGMFNVITGDRAPAAAVVADARVRAVTFTGGTAAGHALASLAGAKKFIAELGSNSANVVLQDADLPDAATRIAAAGFEASGQQCVSAQRVIVEESVYDRFVPLLVAAAAKLKVGDPHDPSTDVGTMVSRAAADRVMAMAANAISQGASYALEPRQDRCTLSPGIIIDASRDADICSKEAFGPLVVVQRARDEDHALELANDSEFGLQGSVFTRSLSATFRFAERFEVGALWINEASRFRLDMYPFGGAKMSGHGREGVRYAIEDLSQIKFIGIRPL